MTKSCGRHQKLKMTKMTLTKMTTIQNQAHSCQVALGEVEGPGQTPEICQFAFAQAENLTKKWGNMQKS